MPTPAQHAADARATLPAADDAGICRRIKNVVKAVRQAVEASSPDAAAGTLNQAKSMIAKAAKKGVIHKKTASRKVSRLSKLAQRPKA